MGVLTDIMSKGANRMMDKNRGGNSGDRLREKTSGGGAASKGADIFKSFKRSKSDGGGGSTGSNSEGDTGESFKHGGKVKRTGLAKVHAGEQVLTGKQAKRYKSRGNKR